MIVKWDTAHSVLKGEQKVRSGFDQTGYRNFTTEGALEVGLSVWQQCPVCMHEACIQTHKTKVLASQDTIQYFLASNLATLVAWAAGERSCPGCGVRQSLTSVEKDRLLREVQDHVTYERVERWMYAQGFVLPARPKAGELYY